MGQITKNLLYFKSVLCIKVRALVIQTIHLSEHFYHCLRDIWVQITEDLLYMTLLLLSMQGREVNRTVHCVEGRDQKTRKKQVAAIYVTCVIHIMYLYCEQITGDS